MFADDLFAVGTCCSRRPEKHLEIRQNAVLTRPRGLRPASCRCSNPQVVSWEHVRTRAGAECVVRGVSEWLVSHLTGTRRLGRGADSWRSCSENALRSLADSESLVCDWLLFSFVWEPPPRGARDSERRCGVESSAGQRRKLNGRNHSLWQPPASNFLILVFRFYNVYTVF